MAEIAPNQPDLAAVLVRLTREVGIGVEQLGAKQLVAEAKAAWPGDLRNQWCKWLAEAAKSLELQARVATLSLEEAIHLVEDGALLVGGAVAGGQPTIVLGYDGKRLKVTDAAQIGSRSIAPDALVAELGPPMEEGSDAPAAGSAQWRWLVVKDLEMSHEHEDDLHHHPVRRLLAIIRPEWSDIWIIAVFAFFAGLLGLATPIAVETLVNFVAFGQLIQPLLILSILLFSFLLFAAIMRALQTYVVEIIQRRLFARVSADLAYRLPRAQAASLDGYYGPELVNRFFDVVTLQKVVAALLLDGVAIVLTTLVGMAVLAVYHPWLFGFDILLLIVLIGGVLLLGRGAVGRAIDESKQKYKLAAWFEDVARCPVGFKTSGGADFAIDRANQITAGYLDSRRRHFGVLFRQLLFILGLQVVVGTVLLGLGGFLVMQEQLTLGQLVAAELIVATILSSLGKLFKHIEGFYDVVAGVDKLGYLFDIDTEAQDGSLAISPGRGARLRVTDVPLDGKTTTFALDAGEQIAIVDHRGVGQNPLCDVLYGLRPPGQGHVEIEHADPRDVRPDTLRRAVTLVRGVEVFEGSVAENVHLGRPGVGVGESRTALHKLDLLDSVLRMPQGIDTKLLPSGEPFRKTQLPMLMLARGVAGEARVLLIDGVLDSLSDAQLEVATTALLDIEASWTLVVITAREDIAERFPRKIAL